MRCDICDANKAELLKTAYGNYICEDCWDDYICTEAGKLEYLIGICQNDYPVSDFDADFLCEVVISWIKYSHLLDFTPEEVAAFEAKAHELEIL